MKNLSIVAFNAFERESGQEMFAIQTDNGVVYATAEYMNRKAKSIGKSIQEILGNAGSYKIVAENVTSRKEGVEFTYTDSSGNEQTSTPNSDYLEVPSFNLALSESGSLNQMIANSVAEKLAAKFGITSSVPSVESNKVSEEKEVTEPTIVVAENEAEII